MFFKLAIFFTLALLCLAVVAQPVNKGLAEKCHAHCDRRFVKHLTDRKGKERCYERCNDPAASGRQRQRRQQRRRRRNRCSCEDGAARRRGCALRGEGPRDKPPAVAGPTRSPRTERGRVRNPKGPARIYQAADEKFRLREIYGDGNCMFRAISYILWGTESRHRHLRSLVVSHVEASWRELQPLVVAEWSMSSLGEYVHFMGADGTFASELECVVAARLNRLNLGIYRRADACGNLRRILYSHFNRRARTANLLFSGCNEFGHYDVLLPQDSRVLQTR